MRTSLFLKRLRRSVAPLGSRRESIARRLYVPVLSLLPSRWHWRLRTREDLRPTVATIDNLRVEGEIRDIVVLKLDHVGDMIIGMPALRIIREGFPAAHITLVCASWNRDWAERLGWFDHIVSFDFFSRLSRDWPGARESLQPRHDAVRLLPLDQYDLAVDLRHDPDTRPCLYRIDARYRAGFHALLEPGLPYLDLVLPSMEGLQVGQGQVRSLHAELRLRLLAEAVVAAFGGSRPHPVAALASPALPAATAPRFAVLAIGAGDPIRCWSTERYAEVGLALIGRHGLTVLVLAGRAEAAEAAALAHSLPAGQARAVIDHPLADMPALVAAATICVCNGSGMSHLAAALGVPTVCILGGTTRMDVWHPAGPRVISIGGVTACQPCGLKHAHECPWGVACLDIVTTADVLAAAERLLAGAEGPRGSRAAHDAR